METNHHPKLTSSEQSVLWGAYQNDTLSICTLSYFLETVEDKEVRAVLEYALELSREHVQTLKSIFKEEKYPTPMGFTEQDVNLQAAKLFSDTFMLNYTLNLGAIGINTYSVALPNSARKDIRDYFTACLHSSAELYNRTVDVMEGKGVFTRPPYIPYPNQVEFVHKQHFLSGWVGEQRPLTTIEISFLFFNLQRNTLGTALLTGFSQVANSNKVRKYLTRGAEIAKHHSAVLGKFLSESNIPTPMTSDTIPTRSTEPPFSDKLVMFHTAAIQTAGIGYYGSSLGGTMRRDLAGAYSRLLTEAGEYTEDGANIMIDNGWMEMPPSAPDRRDLAKG